MKVSELIESLEWFLSKYGDLEVIEKKRPNYRIISPQQANLATDEKRFWSFRMSEKQKGRKVCVI